MSGGSHDRECKAPKSEWRVATYRANYSAFNGYRYTPSAYSLIKCLRCGSMWRTKAAYVDQLKSLSDLERSRA